MLNHVDREREDGRGPGPVPQEGKDREDAVIDRELLTDREVELVVDEASRNVPGERSVAREVRQIALAPSLVRAGKRLGDAEGERGIGVEEKAIEMIVVDHDEKIGCGPGKPLLRGDVAVEKGLPRRLLPCGRGRRHGRWKGHATSRCRRRCGPLVPPHRRLRARASGHEAVQILAAHLRSHLEEVLADGRGDLEREIDVPAVLDDRGPIAPSHEIALDPR